jgi:hypothetical protein
MLAHLNKDYWYNPFYRKQVFVSTFYPGGGVPSGRLYLDPNQDVLSSYVTNVASYVSAADGSLQIGKLTQYANYRIVNYATASTILLTLVGPDGSILHDQIPLTLLLTYQGRFIPISGEIDLNQSYFTFAGSPPQSDTVIVLSFILMEKRPVK